MPHDNQRSESRRTEQARGANTRPDRNESLRAEDLTDEFSAAAKNVGNRIGDIGMKSIHAGLRAQTEMFDALQAIGRDWVTRATSEAELAFNLPNRLTDARSFPDAISTYQQWLSEWSSMRREDGSRLVSDGQRLVATGLRCLASLSPRALAS